MGIGPRLVFRVHAARPADKRKGFTETGYARLLDAAHQQLGGPLVVVWDNVNTHTSRAMRAPIAARPWLTVFQLPPRASNLNPVESAWSLLKRSRRHCCAKRLCDREAVNLLVRTYCCDLGRTQNRAERPIGRLRSVATQEILLSDDHAMA
jgi:transposase